MTLVPHWHSLLPSQTGSNVDHYVGPPHWPSPRCCCEALASSVAERGGALSCERSLFVRSWHGKQPGAVVWGHHWSGHSVQLHVAGGDLPRWCDSSGRHCEGVSTRQWCEGLPLTWQQVKLKLHQHGHCMLRGAMECNRPRRSSQPARDPQLRTW